MKKKILAMLSLVLVLALVPTFVFGLPSRENNGSGSGSSGGGIGIGGPGYTGTTNAPAGDQLVTLVLPDGTVREKCKLHNGSAGTCWRHADTEVKTLANGTVLSTTGATIDRSGTFYRLAINMNTSNGTSIVSDEIGGVAIGNVHVHFAAGEAETAGLPAHIVAQIDALNSGKTASEVFGTTLGVDLAGYERVGNTRAVILTDYTTGLTNTGTEFFVEVEPLDPTGTYAVAYYDNWTGRWNFMPVSVDPTTKLIKMYLPGSCTIQLLRMN